LVNSLTVTDLKASGKGISATFTCEGQLRKFFTGNRFYIRYSESVEGIPDAILIIPFLATVCPVAWANQADIYLDTIDETFLISLEAVKSTLNEYYPTMNFQGKIHAKNIVKTTIKPNSGTMMLFTGGIDSIATYVRHQTKHPILISLRGGFVQDTKEEWTNALKLLNDFSKQTQSSLITVEGNYPNILDKFMLQSYRPKILGNWWRRVMHGLFLLGLCAPMTYSKGCAKLYIASSVDPKLKVPWGSVPEIDNKIKWASTTVEHDSFEVTRQDKIDLISDYMKTVNYDLQIRSCTYVKAKNCSQCEKCSRTILGLELAGIDPSEHGFEITPSTFDNIKRNMLNGNWDIIGLKERMWQDIKSYPLQYEIPHPQAKELIEWLQKTSLADLKPNSSKTSIKIKLLVWRIISPFLKYIPYSIYKPLRKTPIVRNLLFSPLM
jgi:hypothetical protein